MKRANVNYLAAGLMVLSALALLIAVLFQLTGRSGSTERYYMNLESVSGIKYGTPVLYEGYRIGQVESIEPTRSADGLKFRVQVGIENNWPIPEDAVASPATAGLLSDVSLDIKHGESSQYLQPGDDIKTAPNADIFVAMSALANDLSSFTEATLTPFVEHLDSSVDDLVGELDEELPGMIEQLKTVLDGVEQLVGSANEVLNPDSQQSIKEMISSLNETAGEVQILSRDFHGTRENIDQLLGEANAMLQENRPQVNALITDLRLAIFNLGERLDSVGYQMEAASQNLQIFSEQIRQQPNRLLFSDDAEEESL